MCPSKTTFFTFIYHVKRWNYTSVILFFFRINEALKNEELKMTVEHAESVSDGDSDSSTEDDEDKNRTKSTKERENRVRDGQS